MVALHFKVSESSLRTTVKKEKEICETVTAAMPAGMKTLHVLQNTFLSHTENAAFFFNLIRRVYIYMAHLKQWLRWSYILETIKKKVKN